MSCRKAYLFNGKNKDKYLINRFIKAEEVYTWSSETLKIKNQDPPLKLFYDYSEFYASLFDEKVSELGTIDLAKNYIENISIPEFIDEIRERI